MIFYCFIKKYCYKGGASFCIKGRDMGQEIAAIILFLLIISVCVLMGDYDSPDRDKGRRIRQSA